MTESKGTFEVAVISKVRHGRLKRFLQERGWTEGDLAERLGVSGLAVNRWVR